MLRSEIHDSVNNLINTIEKCDLLEIINNALDSESTINIEVTLDAYSKFLSMMQTASNFEHQLLERFGLEKLMDAAFWATMLKAGTPKIKEDIEQVHSSISFFQKHLPKILLITEEYEHKISSAIEAGEQKGLHYARLSVVVMEEQDLSSPQRLILMFESIQGLYEVVGHIKNLSVQDLSVVGCDSGNDKKFDFLGLDQILDGVKDIILNLWDRVIFYRGDQTGKQLKLIAESLPILNEINSVERSGILEQEEAELLRRQAISSINKFFRAGLTIPEMEDFTRYDPRQLMRPDQKLLVAPCKQEKPTIQAENIESETSEVETPSNLKTSTGQETTIELESSLTQSEFSELEESSSLQTANELEPSLEQAVTNEVEPSLERTEFTELEESTKLEVIDNLEPPLGQATAMETETTLEQSEFTKLEESNQPEAFNELETIIKNGTTPEIETSLEQSEFTDLDESSNPQTFDNPDPSFGQEHPIEIETSSEESEFKVSEKSTESEGFSELETSFGQAVTPEIETSSEQSEFTKLEQSHESTFPMKTERTRAEPTAEEKTDMNNYFSRMSSEQSSRKQEKSNVHDEDSDE